ncbi:thiamine phosphate synthase [Paenibacillus sp. UMB4589-SE434]|uniref:thiamine phosphate synthase n=1 Tax=Paenibacillus sp. UMB4589-SE434 TaxID=3046314 RepID=UPI00254A2F26|nr:thiamine phosphate synthase [Paenibacillus sp. UMB4589-SE434]MDK8180368.1 thiamine phosphate synthase [Paenibacillus sp. UMB4589-SE434]
MINKTMSSERTLRHQLKLMFVAGTANCPLGLEHTLLAALKGGITSFQWREKSYESELTAKQRTLLGRRIRKWCTAHKVMFIVNDDVNMAVELEADGVHLGQEDMSVFHARQILPRHVIIGMSAHNVEEARQAVADGANYLGVGPMFHTLTKPDIQQVSGPSVISSIRAEKLTIPIVGIGGIRRERVKQVMDAGADGIAVVQAISAAREIELEVGALYTCVSSIG